MRFRAHALENATSRADTATSPATDRVVMLSRKKVTPVTLASLNPGRELTIDAGHRGQGSLIVRVTDSSKPLYYRYFVGGRRRFELVGYYDPKGAEHWISPSRDDKGTKGGLLTLAAAKESFHALSQLSNAVGDLAEHFRQEEEASAAARRAADLEAKIGSFQDLIDSYVRNLRKAGRASADEIEAILKRNVSSPFPDMAKQQARAITPDHIQEILARIIKRGAQRQMNITRSYLRAAFQYAAKSHDYDPRRIAEGALAFRVQQNPVDLVPRIAEFDRIGTRTLTPDEIRTYFRLLDGVASEMTRNFLKLHLLTGGQRPKQLLAATWSRYDLKDGVVVLLDGKGRGDAREHLVPLIPDAVELLAELKKSGGQFASPFMNREDTPLRLETISKAVADVAATKKNGKRVFETPFTIRDIRRTVETRLVDLGVGKEVRSQLLSHDRGSKIDQTYNKNTYLPQKRAAIEAWHAFLLGDTNSKSKRLLVADLKLVAPRAV